MKRVIFIGLVSLLVVAPIHAQTYKSASLSDWDAVIEAVHEANSNGNGTIILQTMVTIPVDRPLPNVTGIVKFEGNGATLASVSGYNGTIVAVDSTGRLDLSDVYITGFKRGFDHEPEEVAGLIDNSGVLNLERVTIARNDHEDGEFVESNPLLLNRSEASINNTTLYWNDLNSFAAILNHGHMRVSNSTFTANCKKQFVCILAALCAWQCIPQALGSSEGSVTELVNNLISEGGSSECMLQGELVDLGGNFAPYDWCSLDGTKNTLRGSPSFGHFGNNGGFIPTFALQPGSSAIDIGNNDYCSPRDARLAARPVQGELDQENRCDAGAYEYGGGFGNPEIMAGGMNGLWFSRESDGHYVHIMRVSSDRVHVTWTAFDNSARQLWIYAVIPFDPDHPLGESLGASAYSNLDGQLVPGGAPEGSHVEKWGRISLSFESCTKGTFEYKADDSEIGEGEFDMERLAFIEGVGCSD